MTDQTHGLFDVTVDERSDSSWTELPDEVRRKPDSSQGATDGITHPEPHSTLPEYLALHARYFGDDHTAEGWIEWAKITLAEDWDSYEKKREAFEKQRARRGKMTEDMVFRKQEEARKLLMWMWIHGEEQWMEEDENAWRESQTELEREMDEAMDGLKLSFSKSPAPNESKTLIEDAVEAIEKETNKPEYTEEGEEIAWRLMWKKSEKEREAKEKLEWQRTEKERVQRERLVREQEEREMVERECQEIERRAEKEYLEVRERLEREYCKERDRLEGERNKRMQEKEQKIQEAEQRAEKERAEKERAEKERAEKENAEKEAQMAKAERAERAAKRAANKVKRVAKVNAAK
ncbi:hypothetical protein B0H34DRAFT_272292 [Crassisporium funariophilum]|nr:hypothetical protein B0H34DRAFT_272292 [Crassisporium funariophilum]